VRRSLAKALWRVLNPLAMRLAGRAPWWVVLETTGRRSGQPRRTPLARGPRDGHTTWIVAVHGRHAGFVRNLLQEPRVRLQIRGRWHDARASVGPMDPAIVGRFNLYARSGPRTLGIDPVLVRLDLDR
jgi:deazaflavin-dependent oxidoreductase (nitroreductase family)